MTIERVWNQAKDEHVAAYVVYGKTGKIYYDSANTEQVTKADMEDAFRKGRLMVNDGTNLLVVVSMANGKCKTVGMGASAVELTEWAAK